MSSFKKNMSSSSKIMPTTGNKIMSTAGNKIMSTSHIIMPTNHKIIQLHKSQNHTCKSLNYAKSQNPVCTSQNYVYKTQNHSRTQVKISWLKVFKITCKRHMIMCTSVHVYKSQNHVY